MVILRKLLPVAALLLVMPLGCGSSDVGEECDDIGDSDECEDHAICTNEDGHGVCRWMCENDDHCASDHECNGVAGTNVKSCQPK